MSAPLAARARTAETAVFGLALALLISCCAPGKAQGQVSRFGLFIGNNRGAAHELPLRYAAGDAQRMQETLVELGGFSPLDAVVLRDPDATTARGALIALNDRIRAAAARPDAQVMLFVYYSGHADRRALHLGETQLPLLELEQLVRGSAAHFRVLLVDACGSGALTRAKGGSPAPAFAVQLGERLDGQGVAFMTSSSASEDAQESDELGGSFFTHHFISGLLGAADANEDDKVDLEEAYRYAYESTLRSTSRTWAGTQHPTFRFELNGNASAVLSEPRKSAARAQLVFPGGRDYLVLRGGESGSVVAEVSASAQRRRISLRPDRYFVRGRASSHVLEGQLQLNAGETRLVADDLLERVEYARLVRKGGHALAHAGGPLAGYSLRSPLSRGTGACHGLFAGYAFAWRALTVTPRLDACTGNFENARVQASMYELGGDVRIAHVWDLPAVSLDIGFAVGASWLRQSFTTRGVAPARDSVALRSSVGPSATFELGSGLYFTTDVAAETYAFHLQDTATREEEIAASLAFRARAGFGKQW